ncbi:hypothetical protein AWM70_07705 [Paenibacillus yonginensis]|uniref:Uncharacterized protein n=1 Tax=Paenibacillus yonginensis TaxID=1462996 RepID=A0A1B1MZ86_9BACL|nr:endospore germination permease [Paenibacillus yonginensis]ANS74483.1 hypothetical protein AWM70_07705 [Paenibacillus yonginensis]
MKLSGNQLFWIMFCFQVHYALIPALQYGKQDAWLICLLSGAGVIVITCLIAQVSQLSPGDNLAEICRKLLGKWVGNLILLLYVVVWFFLTAVTLREWADYVYLKLLPGTPVSIVVLPMSLLLIYANLKGGIFAIGRCSQIIGPLYFLISFAPVLLMFGIMDWTNLLPIYADTGVHQIVKGAVPTLGNTMGGAMMPLMLTAFMQQPQQATKYAVRAMGLSSLWVLIAVLISVLVLGSHLAPQLTLPWVVSIRSISILNFIQNIDAIAVFVYSFSHFIALSASTFVTSYGLAQLIHKKLWKLMVVCVVGLSFLAVVLTSDVGHITNLYRDIIWVRWVLPVNMIGIPLLLWIIGKMKKEALQ